MAEKETKNGNVTPEEPITKEQENGPDSMTEDEATAKQAADRETCEAETEEMPESEAPSQDAENPAEGSEEAADEARDPEGEDKGKEKPKKERKLKWARSGETEKKPDPIEEKIKEYTDRYARLFAEFDNFRKRSDKEKTQRYDFGVKDTVEKILPVIDNFERGLAAVPAEQAEDSFVTGMQMIYKQLMKALEDIGVKPIEAVGQEFNPDFHNAVMHVDDPEAGDNIIVEEFQKGYMYKDHVVRYSMVKVAN